MSEPHWLLQELTGQAVWTAVAAGGVWVWKRHGDKLVAVYRVANRELIRVIVWCDVALAELSDKPSPQLEDADVTEALEAARDIVSTLDLQTVVRNVLTIPVLRYEPMKVRWIPPRYSYEPMRIRYRPMKVVLRNGLPYITPPVIDLEPPRLKVKPGHLDFTHGRFILGD